MMRKANTNNKHNIIRDVLIGLVTSAIWFFVQWLIGSAPQTGRTLLATIQNSVYSCVAQTSLYSMLLLVISFILSFCLAFTFSAYIYSVRNRIYLNKNRRIERNLKLIEVCLNSENDLSTCKVDLDKTAKELKAIQKKKNDSNSKIDKVLGILFAVIIPIYVYFIITTILVPVSLLDRFNKDIQMIKPYTDSKTIMILESDWTRMKSKTDYDYIYIKIQEIKNMNSL